MKLQRPPFMIYSEKLQNGPVGVGMTILHPRVSFHTCLSLANVNGKQASRGRTPAQLEDVLRKTGYVVFRIDCAKVREVPPSCLKLKYTGWGENAMATFSCTGRRLDGCTEPCMLLFWSCPRGGNPHPSCPALQAEEPGKGDFNTVSWAWLCPPCCQPLSLYLYGRTLNKSGGRRSQDFAASALLISGARCLPTAGVPAHGGVWGSSPDLH